MEQMTGLLESFWNFTNSLLIWSDAMTSPPGELTLRITALTRLSLAARSSWARMMSTIVLPVWSTWRLVIMPSTVTTAILLRAPLSLRVTSSRRGPERALADLNERSRLPGRPMCDRTACAKLPNTLNRSRMIKIIEKIIQPRPLRALAACGATITGGAAGGGGVANGGGTSPGGTFESIMREATAKNMGRQGG